MNNLKYDNKVIVELKIYCGDEKPKDGLYKGFEKVDIDLNKTKNNSKYIYLYYRLDNMGNAITDICFVIGKNKEAPNGYTKIDVDLNAGAGGDYIYLCYTIDTQYPPILDLRAIISDTADVEPEPINSEFIRINQDLNAGCGGQFIYLCYKPDYKSVPQRDLVFYVFSDTHLDASDCSKENELINLNIKKFIKADMNRNNKTLAIIPGDLMHDNNDMDDMSYLNIWGNSSCNQFDLTVCDGFGNHDVAKHLEKDGYNGRYRKIANEQAPFRSERLKNNFYFAVDVRQDISGGKDHHFKQALYRWRHYLNGINFHFIMMNLGMMKDENIPSHTAHKTKEFLTSSLARIPKTDPIFIFQHYGFDAQEVNHDDDHFWWPENDQLEFLKKIQAHNVITMFYGHRHSFHKGEKTYKINNKEYQVPMSYCVGGANTGYKDKPVSDNYDWREHHEGNTESATEKEKQKNQKLKVKILYEQIQGSLDQNKNQLVTLRETMEL